MKTFLEKNNSDLVSALLDQTLFSPTNLFLSNKGKNFRGTLIEIGFEFIRGLTLDDKNNCSILSSALEVVHAGSLIIDDIQDNSKLRRGRPSLHETLGTPLAINAGNWLYFKTYEILKTLKISNEQKLALYEAFNETILTAHYGQALDLGTDLCSLKQDQIRSISNEIIKSGLVDRLGSGVVLTGGASELDGLIEMGEFIFDVPVRRGVPFEVGGLTDVVRSPSYATSVGLLLYAKGHFDKMKSPHPNRDIQMGQFLGDWTRRLKDLFSTEA